MTKKAVLTQKLRQQVGAALENGRVLLFSAPCGFGKTTAAQQLISGRQVCRLSAATPDFHLPSAGGKWKTLLIDDLQYLTDEELQQELCALARQDPERRFVFLSRGEPPGWLIPFQTTGVMTVLHAKDLCLDRESVTRLLQEHDIAVSDVVLTSILQESKGYPLALDILMSHLARGEAYDETTKDLVRREIFLYYEEMVYRRLHLSARRMLLDLSPFACFDLELARILSGNSRAGEILGRLQRDTTMFLNKRLGCYSFWPLFRDFLLWKMDQEYSEEQKRDLYNRGGLYYELKEDYGNALACYARIDAYAKISELLVKNAQIHPGMGHYDEMEPYYRGLPKSEILESPALMQGMSMLCAICMDYEGSERWYQALRHFVQGKNHFDSDVREAKSRLAWLDIALPQRSVDSAVELFPNLFRMVSNKEIRMSPLSVTSTLPSLMNGGKDFSPWSKKDDFLYATLRLPVEAILGRDGVCMADCALAESKFEKGEDIRDRIMGLLQKMDKIRRDGSPDIEFAVVGLLVRMQLDLGWTSEARKSLQEIKQRFAEAGETRFMGNMDAMLCRIDLLQGEELAADNWYREKAPRNPQHLKVMKRYQYFTQAMVELSRGEEQQALITLAPLDTYCKNCSRYIDSIHLHLLAGIALFRMGEDRWRAEVCAALDTAWEFRFVRTVSQYGAAVLPLLEGCGWRGDETFLYTLVRTSREQASLYPDYLHPRQEMTAPLSATELQVLRLICANKSNAEIGEILDIKLSTVKTHVSSILRKLGIQRRNEAKETAERLHLIH